MNLRELELKMIADHFATWEAKIRTLNSINLYDANIFSESLICDLLNLIFNYELTNANAIKKNFPGLDLVDKVNRIGFQITSTKTKSKVQGTLDKFFENGLDKDLDEIFVVILGTKQLKYSNLNAENGFNFDAKKHILDFADLLRLINFLPTVKIKQIGALLTSENSTAKVKASTKDNSSKIKKILALKKKLKRDFLIDTSKWERNLREKSWYEPYIAFRHHNVLIRSVDDTTWPNVEESKPGEMSSWFKGEFWSFYDNGIELIGMGGYAIEDEAGNWDVLDWRGDKRENNLKYKKIGYQRFLRIPFQFIVDYEMETDPYNGCPSIYVKYAKNGMPYEEILYGQQGNHEMKRFTWYFDNEKRVKLV